MLAAVKEETFWKSRIFSYTMKSYHFAAAAWVYSKGNLNAQVF